MSVNGVGRPSKGHRIRLVTRVDARTHLLAVKAAAASGLTLSEWLAKVVEDRVEVPA